MESSGLNSHSKGRLLEAADLLSPYVNSLKVLVESTVEAVNAGKEEASKEAISLIADRISRLITIVTLLHRECAGSLSNFEDLKSVEIHLLSVLKAIQTAENTQDMTMLSDLLEYELQDNLTQWKIKAIPQIKRRLLA